MVAATVFGIVPCILGVGIGQVLRWSDTIWLTDAGGFWPITGLVASVAALVKRAISPFDDRTTCVASWLVVAWTWLYFPLWFTAREIPQSSAVVTTDGRVFVAGEGVRQPSARSGS